MKFLQENNKGLDRFLSALGEELRREIKFSKHKLSDQQLAHMCMEHLRHIASVSPRKQNKTHLTESQQLTQSTRKKNEEQHFASELPATVKVQREMSRKMFIELNKQKLNSPFTSSTQNTPSLSSGSELLNSPKCNEFQLEEVAVMRSITQQAQLLQIFSPQTAKNLETGRRKPFVFENSGGQNIKDLKSKTYSQLRKLEAVFCVGKSRQQRKRNSMAESCWWDSDQRSYRMLSQQNENLKTIQSSLTAHLKLLEQHRPPQTLQALMEKQESLSRRQQKLKDQQKLLLQRELKLSKNMMSKATE